MNLSPCLARLLACPPRYEVEIFYAKAPEADYVDAAIQSVLRIHTQVEVGLAGQPAAHCAVGLATRWPSSLCWLLVLTLLNPPFPHHPGARW